MRAPYLGERNAIMVYLSERHHRFCTEEPARSRRSSAAGCLGAANTNGDRRGALVAIPREGGAICEPEIDRWMERYEALSWMERHLARASVIRRRSALPSTTSPLYAHTPRGEEV